MWQQLVESANFTPPEFFSEMGEAAVENIADSGWQCAIQYQDLKKRASNKYQLSQIRKISVSAIISKARKILGSVARPKVIDYIPWELDVTGEIDLDRSLELDPMLQSLVTERLIDRRAEIVICLDTSLSMTGQKMAMVAVTIAAIALQLKMEDFGVVVFDTDARVLKPLGSSMALEKLLIRFLESPARGLTNIEAALQKAHGLLEKGHQTRRVGILMSDGRFTAGGRPEHAASKFRKLHVVQTGSPWSSTRFCKNLAKKGGGKLIRVTNMRFLPKSLYDLVHESLR